MLDLGENIIDSIGIFANNSVEDLVEFTAWDSVRDLVINSVWNSVWRELNA